LALSALHDKAFDLGVITLDEDLRVCVTRKLCESEDGYFNDSLMAFDGKKVADAGKFSPDPKFLDHHRNSIFEKTKLFGNNAET
jgi:predicted restriction endonuclease